MSRDLARSRRTPFPPRRPGPGCRRGSCRRYACRRSTLRRPDSTGIAAPPSPARKEREQGLFIGLGDDADGLANWAAVRRLTMVLMPKGRPGWFRRPRVAGDHVGQAGSRLAGSTNSSDVCAPASPATRTIASAVAAAAAAAGPRRTVHAVQGWRRGRSGSTRRPPPAATAAGPSPATCRKIRAKFPRTESRSAGDRAGRPTNSAPGARLPCRRNGRMPGDRGRSSQGRRRRPRARSRRRPQPPEPVHHFDRGQGAVAALRSRPD